MMLGANPLPMPSAAIDWTHAVSSWPMLGNDVCGDCTIAAALHAVQLWTANAGTEIVPDTACALSGYAAATGYNPKTGTNDNGAVENDILLYWMHTGLPVASIGALDQLDGFAAIEPDNLVDVKRAIAAFGVCYAGVELPIEAEEEFDAGKPWANTTGRPGTWGGHGIPLVAYDAEGLICVTWGKLQRLTWQWWQAYGVESYALLRREWIGRAGTSPSGLTMEEFDARLLRMRGILGLGADA
jgi:hypothetical protein